MVNSKAFTPEEVSNGLLQDLLNYLFSYNEKSTKYFYDIHITSDGCCTIVQWCDASYTLDAFDGEFKFVPSDCVIMKEISLPDDSIQYCLPEDVDAVMQAWEKANKESKNG